MKIYLKITVNIVILGSKMTYFMKIYDIKIKIFYNNGGGGVQPHFCPWKNVCFPIFSHGENKEKSIWKEREMNTFPFLSIYFFLIFPHGEKWENTHFSMAKMGLDPPKYMNYKEITADEYEKLLQNKKDIFNNTFKNTNKLVEDKKQVLKTDPDAIIKKQQKDDYIEKLSDLISQKINNTDDLKKISDKIDLKKITDGINLKEIADKIDLKNDETSQPSYKNDYIYYIKNPNILADKIVEIYDANPNAKVYNPKNKKIM